MASSTRGAHWRKRNGNSISTSSNSLVRLEFVFHDDSALSVSLVGDFNRWDTRDVGFVRDESGVWRTRIESPVAGRYQYKLVVDESRWIEDPANLMKAPDGFGGYNSVLHFT